MKTPVLKNTATNYLMVIVSLLQGLLVTRWMIHSLGNTYYGLWGVLWSFFMYGLLLDFGLGITAQKYTAANLWQKDLKRYNMVISTIFSFHAMMSILILAATCTLAVFAPRLFSVSDPELISYCRQCVLLFGIGVALVFPTGIFPEIIIGMRAIYLRNYVMAACKVVELIGVLLILTMGGRLRVLIVFNIAIMLAINLSLALAAKRRIPGFRLQLHVERSILREIVHFSGYMYVMSISRLVMNNMSRPLISAFCNLNSAGIFQIASRFPNFCSQFTNQYQENVSPMTAGLYAEGKITELRNVILNSMRWNSFLATGVTVVAYTMIFYALAAFYKLTNLEIEHLSKLFLISLWIQQTMRAVPQRFMIMADHHKLAAVIAAVEAALMLIGFLLFIPRFGIESVLWVSIAARLALALIVVLPFLIRFFHFSIPRFIWKVYLLPLLAAAPTALLLNWFASQNKDGHAWIVLFSGGAMGGVLYLLISYFFLLSPDERRLMWNKAHELWRRKFPRASPPAA